MGQRRPESETVVRNVYHCKICNFAVRHKRGTITGHLKKRHNVKLVDYSEKFESGD